MKRPSTPTHLLRSCLLLAALPLGALAQTTPPAAAESAAGASSATTYTAYGPQAGDREFTLGFGGASNRYFNSTLGGGAASFGYYLNDTSELLFRQSLDFSDVAGLGQPRKVWNADSALAFDEMLVSHGPIRPFVGANLGYVYGDSVRSSWNSGLEAGAKVYVLPKTFLFAMAGYDWFFRHDETIPTGFRSGQWNWSTGVGFTF